MSFIIGVYPCGCISAACVNKKDDQEWVQEHVTKMKSRDLEVIEVQTLPSYSGWNCLNHPDGMDHR